MTATGAEASAIALAAPLTGSHADGPFVRRGRVVCKSRG